MPPAMGAKKRVKKAPATARKPGKKPAPRPAPFAAGPLVAQVLAGDEQLVAERVDDAQRVAAAAFAAFVVGVVADRFDDLDQRRDPLTDRVAGVVAVLRCEVADHVGTKIGSTYTVPNAPAALNGKFPTAPPA